MSYIYKNQLPKKSWLTRLLCRHKVGFRVLNIAWDGETTAQCVTCGTIKRKGLQ